MNIDEWKTQLKRGTLEFCILLIINQNDCYGYEMMSNLEKWSIIAAKESTIYPLLRRLLNEEYLTSYWQDAGEGLPPRKYYSITEKGREYLSLMAIEWAELMNAVEHLKGVNEFNGQ